MAQRAFTQTLSSFLTLAAVALATSSCSGKKSAAPVDASARVYVALRTNPASVLVFDTELDSLVDTLILPASGAYSVVGCDPGEPRLAVFHGHTLYLFRAGESESYAQLQTENYNFAFDSRRNLLIVTGGIYGGETAPRVELYYADALVSAFVDSVALSTNIELDRERGLVFGVSNYELTPGAGIYRNELCAYDYVNRRLSRCWNILPDSAGRGYRITAFVLHSDGRRAYLVAARIQGSGARIVGYDLERDSALFDYPMTYLYGEPAVTPDGKGIWVPEVGGGYVGAPGEIFVRDAQNGSVRSVIELDAYRIHPLVPVAPRYIRFTPDGTKAYVVSISDGGPIFVIDTHTLEVRKIWYTDTVESLRRAPQTMDIGPAP